MPTYALTSAKLDRDEYRAYMLGLKTLPQILRERQEVLDGVAAFEMGVDDYEAGRTYDGDNQVRESDYREGWEFAKDRCETAQRQAWSKALSERGAK